MNTTKTTLALRNPEEFSKEFLSVRNYHCAGAMLVNLINGEYLAERPAVIEYNPKWANGTGYLDHAVNGIVSPRLDLGEIVSFTDDVRRKGVIIGLGEEENIVIFQRYTDGQNDVTVFNVNHRHAKSNPILEEMYYNISTSLKCSDLAIVLIAVLTVTGK